LSGIFVICKPSVVSDDLGGFDSRAFARMNPTRSNIDDEALKENARLEESDSAAASLVGWRRLGVLVKARYRFCIAEFQ
jgi:hypothetical protein